MARGEGQGAVDDLRGEERDVGLQAAISRDRPKLGDDHALPCAAEDAVPQRRFASRAASWLGSAARWGGRWASILEPRGGPRWTNAAENAVRQARGQRNPESGERPPRRPSAQELVAAIPGEEELDAVLAHAAGRRPRQVEPRVAGGEVQPAMERLRIRERVARRCVDFRKLHPQGTSDPTRQLDLAVATRGEVVVGAKTVGIAVEAAPHRGRRRGDDGRVDAAAEPDAHAGAGRDGLFDRSVQGTAERTCRILPSEVSSSGGLTPRDGEPSVPVSLHPAAWGGKRDSLGEGPVRVVLQVDEEGTRDGGVQRRCKSRAPEYVEEIGAQDVRAPPRGEEAQSEVRLHRFPCAVDHAGILGRSAAGRMGFAMGERFLRRRLEDEELVVDLEGGQFFGLNETASRILELWREGVRGPTAIADVLVSEFEVDRDTARAAVEALLAQAERMGWLGDTSA